jgi:hypothetical protein
MRSGGKTLAVWFLLLSLWIEDYFTLITLITHHNMDNINSDVKVAVPKEIKRSPWTALKNFNLKTLTTWIENPQVWGFAVSVVIMALVSVAFFFPDNFEGNVLSQHDMQQGAANGQEGHEYEAQTGEKALWTNSLFSGMPTFQISPSYPSNSLFTWLNSVYGLGLPAPSNLLFMMMLGFLIMLYCMKLRWWYALIGALAWGLSSYFVIIIGAGHIWKFMALTYVPPTIGAVVLAYRGRYLAGATMMALFAMLELNANHPQITYYSLYIIGLLAVAYLIEAIRRHDTKRWGVASLSLLVAGALALCANLPSLYHTYEYAKETKRAGSELTSEQAVVNNGQRPTGGLPKEEIGGWSNLPEESLSLLIPNIKGGATILPQKGENTLLSLDKTDEYKKGNYERDDIAQLMPQLPQYFGGKGLTNGPFYVGALICALFLAGCIIVKGPVKWTMLTMTILSILLAMGNHFEALSDFMIYNVPMFNKFRAAETWLVVAALTMPLMAILALKELLTEGLNSRRAKIGLYGGFGVAILLCFIAWVAPGVFGDTIAPDEASALDSLTKQAADYSADAVIAVKQTIENIQTIRLSLVSADAMRSMMFLIIGGVVIYFAAKKKISTGMAATATALLVLFDLYTVDKRYISTDSFVSPNMSVQDIKPDDIDKQIMADKGHYRVYDLVGFGDARRSYFHSMIGGYHAAKLRRYDDLISHQINNIQNYYRGADIPEAKVEAAFNVLNMLNAKYLILGNEVQQNPDALGNAWLVNKVNYVNGANAEMAALDTLDPANEAVADAQFKAALGEAPDTRTVGDAVALKEYTPNRLSYDVNTANGGIVVFSEVWFPWGWNATIDGAEAQLGRVNYTLRAMRVPAGHHEITMTFDPKSLHVTSSLAYTSITIIYILVLASILLYMARLAAKEND